MKNTFKNATDALEKNDTNKAIAILKQAIAKSPLDTKKIIASVILLRDHGEYEGGFSILQDYTALGGSDTAVLEVMAMIAMDLNAYDTALKILNILINTEPSKTNHYVNYCDCLVKTGRAEEAISLIQTILPQFPTAHSLWNLLGTILKDELGDTKGAEPFFLEAYRLAPNDFNITNNLGNLYAGSAECYQYYQKAIELKPDDPSPHIGIAIRLFLDERWLEAYPHYEYRLAPNQGLSKSPTYIHPGEGWKGQPLKGKSILVMAEQGIGDEAFFSLHFNRLCLEADQVYISCDTRLINIFKRSFPKAHVIPYKDEQNGAMRSRSFPDLTAFPDPDYAIHAGSLTQYFWPAPESIAPILTPALHADTALVDKFSVLINKEKKNVKVGISWRSGNQSGERKKGHISLDTLDGLLKTKGVDFYCLQYDLSPEEEEYIQQHLPQLHIFKDVDLKQNIEANLAIIKNLNLVVGPATATQMFAMLSNVPTCFILWGIPWWGMPRFRSDGPHLMPKATWHHLYLDTWQTDIQQKILAFSK